MTSPHLFKQNLPENSPLNNYSIKKYTQVIAATQQNNVFPLLTLNHLAVLTDINYFFLRRVISRREECYTKIQIPKNNGKIRIIYEPSSDLKVVQRWILRNILNKVKSSPNCYAYTPGKSVIDCATVHLGAKTLVRLDFSDFFHSLNVKDVYTVFRRLGYTAILSYELSRICTVPVKIKYFADKSAYPYSDPLHNSILGQGLPTSGVLANIIMKEFDDVINNYCLKKSLVYSRYSDDLFISSSTKLKKEVINELIKFIKVEAKNKNIILNEKKTVVLGPGRHKKVLGIILTDQGLRLPSDFSESLRKHILNSSKIGLKRYSEHRNFRTPEGFINYIDGKLSWMKMVDPQKSSNLSSIWLATKNEYYSLSFTSTAF